MRLLNEALRLFSAGVLAFALTATMSAQAQGQKEADRQQNETSITGCLSKDATGGYTIADEKTGAKTSVTGTADLEKHSANHKVTLTGTSKMDSGKSVFTVTKIQHVAAECKAPAQ
jgi:hypothetical protein